jgi:N-acylglucosamine 2-epimerase/mannose-6-phosphate isomerase
MADQELIAKIRTWMFEDALPFWTTHGLDHQQGGVVESFAMDGVSPSGVGFKRTRVACRQLYVFSHAQLLGYMKAAPAADHAFAALRDQFWLGTTRGWARKLSNQGVVLDSTPDLYDYAFVLFSLGWRYKASGDLEAKLLAYQTLEILERDFRHSSGQGFKHEIPGCLPRQQNPHMHLVEAALVAHEAFDDARFGDLAQELVLISKTRFLKMPEGVLPEFYEEDLSPVADDRWQWIEPGHQFEWAWILARHQLATGTDNSAAIRALVAWAERYGVDRVTGLTFNRVAYAGTPLDRGSRTWPNTERIKGWLGLYEITGQDPRVAVRSSIRALLDRHLGQGPRGCWIENFDGDLSPKTDVIPASTLYHVFLAFAEVLRLAPTYTQRGSP